MAKVIKEWGFYRNVLRIALPIAGQNLISVGVNMTDTVMLGALGEVTISACSLANQLSFIMFFMYNGLSAGASILSSQYWGKRQTDMIERIMGVAMQLSMITGVCFAVVGLVFPEQFISIYNRDPEVLAQGSTYLRIISVTFLLQAVTVLYININRAVENVNIGLYTMLISFGMNVGLNAVLIFGLIGFPKMGIAGAALATAISRVVEFLIVVFYAKFKNKIIKLRLKYLFQHDKALLKNFVMHSLPVVGNEAGWGIGMSIRTALMSNLGTAVTAAQNIVDVVSRLTFVFLFGVADASAVLVGKSIGEQRLEHTKDIAKTIQVISVGIGVFSALFLLIARTFITKIGLFSLTPLAEEYLLGMMLAQCVINLFAAFNTVNIVGIIRGGGDTKVSFLLDVVSMYCVGIPIGALAAYWLGLPVPLVFLLMASDEIVKLIVGYRWYKSGKWIKELTR